jgi:NAD(P)-dependent dehydrogenase (short-subunit alcohol dehydrogenase family)
MADPKAIVVTGASRGIGAAIAAELARRGQRVACLSRSGTRPAAADAEALAQRLHCIACDVSREDELKAALRNAADWGGGLSGLVNNAGIHSEGPSRSFPTHDFEEILRVNTTAVFVASREAYPYLVEAGGGLIVNIGSFFEQMAAKGSTAYCASKAAVAAITRCLAAEWGRKGISVLDVAPGYIETEINRDYLRHPVHGEKVRSRVATGRAGTPDEVARLIAALYTERIQFLTGATITIDGGHSASL